MQSNEGKGLPGKMMQPAMNEYKNPRPNPRGPKHHISCRLCYLFILQYSPTSRGVKLLSKLIIVNDRIEYKVCYPLKIYNIVFNTTSVYHCKILKLFQRGGSLPKVPKDQRDKALREENPQPRRIQSFTGDSHS